jgi:hypothetical protein
VYSSVLAADGRVFAIGDVAAHEYPEPALAHTSEKHAAAVACSVQRLVAAGVYSTGSQASAADGIGCLVAYPSGLSGTDDAPLITAVSLGTYNAMLAFNTLQITNQLGLLLGAVAKYVLERTKVWQLQNWLVGVWLWYIGDHAVMLINRWLLRPRPPQAVRVRVRAQPGKPERLVISPPAYNPAASRSLATPTVPDPASSFDSPAMSSASSLSSLDEAATGSTAAPTQPPFLLRKARSSSREPSDSLRKRAALRLVKA